MTDLGRHVMHGGESIFDEMRRAWAARARVRDSSLSWREQLTAFLGAETVRLDSPGWSLERDD